MQCFSELRHMTQTFDTSIYSVKNQIEVLEQFKGIQESWMPTANNTINDLEHFKADGDTW